MTREDVLALRARAPIAGQYEDCIQAFDKLSSALKACRMRFENAETKKEYAKAKKQLEETFNLTDEGMTKLQVWDNDLGASSQALDHALRGSSRLSTTAIGHLVELHEVLTRGAFIITEIQQAMPLS